MMEAIREEINSLGWISVLFGLGVVLLTLMWYVLSIQRMQSRCSSYYLFGRIRLLDSHLRENKPSKIHPQSDETNYAELGAK